MPSGMEKVYSIFCNRLVPFLYTQESRRRVLIADIPPFAYAGAHSPTVNIEADSLSHALQTEHLAPRPAIAAARLWPPVWQLAALNALLLWLYWPTLSHLIGQWWHDPNFSHGFFVPLFSGFVIWQELSKLARVKLYPSWSGLLLLGLGLCILVVGQMGAEIFLSRFSLLIVLAGLVVLFLGWNFFRAVLFPWAFLLLM